MSPRLKERQAGYADAVQRAGATPTGLTGQYASTREWVSPPRPYDFWQDTDASYAKWCSVDESIAVLPAGTVDRVLANLAGGRWHTSAQLAVGIPGDAITNVLPALWAILRRGTRLEERDHWTWTDAQWAAGGATVGTDVRLADGAQDGLF